MGTRKLGRTLGCVSLLLASLGSQFAHAEGSAADSDRANLLFKKGKVAFNAGKFDDALRIYSEAWSLKKSPDIAANLAQAESELSKHRDAAEHFAYALAHILPSSTDEQRAALAEGLESEKKEIGSLRVTLEPADSVLTIDDVAVPVPPNGDVYIDAGEHRTSVTHEGYEPYRQTLRVSKGASQVLWIKLLQAGSAAPSPTEPRPSKDPLGTVPPRLGDSSARSITPALVGGGLVVAGAALGVVFHLSGNSSGRDADALRHKHSEANACGTGTPYADDCSALHGKNLDVDRARSIEVVGFSVAGAAAVGTALYLLWPHSSSAAASHWSPSFAVAPGGGGGGFGLAGRF